MNPALPELELWSAVILDNLADGITAEDIVTDYPPLTLIDIRAAIDS